MKGLSLFFNLVILLLVCKSNSEHSENNEDIKDEENGFFGLKNFGTAREILDLVLDVVGGHIWTKAVTTFKPIVDVAKLLVSTIDSEITVTDVTSATEAVHGHEFDKFEEKQTNMILTGIALDELGEYNMSLVASATGLPDSFLQAISLGKGTESNESQQSEFKFNVGDVTSGWYCIATTAKRGDNKIDLALAFYNLNFRLADRIQHHSEVKRFLGVKLWTNRWMSSEPRKLNSEDQEHFTKYLQFKAVSGFVKKYPNYQHLAQSSDDGEQ